MAAQSRAIPLVLTRPEIQADRFATELRDRFGDAMTVIISPLLAPRFLQPDLGPGPWAAVVFTSATAVAATRFLGFAGSALPRKAYCVGDKTADEARKAGFSAISAKGDAGTLCARIVAQHEVGPLLHIRGQDTLGDVAGRLRLAGIVTEEAIVYVELPQDLSVAARAVLSRDVPVILPVFSPRTAMILSQELAEMKPASPVVTVAFSPAVAKALEGIAAHLRFVSVHPDAPSMLTAINDALIAAQAA